MTFLVDANVLSEATKPAPHEAVVDWLRHNEREIAVDPIILGEIRFGILLLPAGSRAKLLAGLRASGRSMPIKDSLIAATALVHDLVVVTRNARDFTNAGLKVIDPFT